MQRPFNFNKEGSTIRKAEFTLTNTIHPSFPLLGRQKMIDFSLHDSFGVENKKHFLGERIMNKTQQ